jgi:iron(II)-dependent oxidoreductase
LTITENGVQDTDWAVSVKDQRYCRKLTESSHEKGGAHELQRAWQSLETLMAVVPRGEVIIANAGANSFSRDDNLRSSAEAEGHRIAIESYYIDRYAVTNAEYYQFVAAGGYDQRDLWPEDIYAHVLKFVDATGYPGPAFWSQGKPPRDRHNHPVVGICWYEANAYAMWCGKRLPTCCEWQRAGTWSGDGMEPKYPWGNSFDPKRANIWSSGKWDTVPVDAFFEGSTLNGIYQLVGNVWEWVGTLFECPDGANGTRIFMEQPLAEIRGGAFDTYFASQATCQFRTGLPLLSRNRNVGFRCCTSVDSLKLPSDPYAFLEETTQ